MQINNITNISAKKAERNALKASKKAERNAKKVERNALLASKKLERNAKKVERNALLASKKAKRNAKKAAANTLKRNKEPIKNINQHNVAATAAASSNIPKVVTQKRSKKNQIALLQQRMNAIRQKEIKNAEKAAAKERNKAERQRKKENKLMKEAAWMFQLENNPIVAEKKKTIRRKTVKQNNSVKQAQKEAVLNLTRSQLHMDEADIRSLFCRRSKA